MHRLASSIAIVAGALIAIVPTGRVPSIEGVFVAATEAAAEAEETVCIMPNGDEQQIAVPPPSDTEGGDIPPVRMVVTPPARYIRGNVFVMLTTLNSFSKIFV